MKQNGQSKLKNCIWIFLLAAAILFGVFSAVRGARLPLHHVEKLLLQDERIWGVDEHNQIATVFSADPDGYNAIAMTFPQTFEDEGRFLDVVDLQVIDGIVRVFYRETLVNDYETQESGWYVDFDLARQSAKAPQSAGQLPSELHKEIRPGELWTVDAFGNVWEEAEDDIRILDMNGTQKDAACPRIGYSFGVDGLYFFDLTEQQQYMIPYHTGIKVPCDKSLMHTWHDGEAFVRDIYQMPDYQWTMALNMRDNRLLPAIMTEDPVPLEEISFSFQQVLTEGILAAGLFLAVALMVIGIVRVIKLCYGGTIPTVLRIFVTTALLLGVGYVLLGMNIRPYLMRQVQREEKANLYHFVETASKNIEIHANDRSEKLGQPSCIAGLDQDFLNQQISRVSQPGKVYDSNLKLLGEYADERSIYSLYSRGETGFYELDGSNLRCSPMHYRIKWQDVQMLHRQDFSYITVTNTQTETQWGQCLVAYHSILNQDGEMIGVLKGIVPQSRIENEVNQRQFRIMLDFRVFLIVLLCMLTISSAMVLHPLGKLRKGMHRAAEGEKPERIPVKGGSELAEMSDLYNRMGDNLNSLMQRAANLKSAYEPYVPQRLVDCFHKADIREITTTDRASVSAAILRGDILNFFELAELADSSNLFSYMGQAAHIMTEEVEKENGIVSQFSELGITAFFPEGEEAAARAAVSMQEKLSKLPEILKDHPLYYGFGIVQGQVELGVVGTKDRMEVITVSQDEILAEELFTGSCRYRTGALLLDAEKCSTKQMRRSKNMRFVGYMQLSEGRKKPVYEAYSGLPQQTQKLRKDSADAFEHGVILAAKGEFTQARQHFIAVLRADQADLLAGEYFRWCDKEMHRTEQK